MADLAELEARIRVLEDIEAIKRLRHKYFRCLDGKLWDEMAECFTPDATTSYTDGQYQFHGVDAIMGFVSERLGRGAGRTSVHQGHHPEIEITSDTTAKGTWSLYAYGIGKQANDGRRIGAFYHDEYVKEKGKWKIKSTGYTQIFEETWDRGETQSLKLVADMFASPEQSASGPK